MTALQLPRLGLLTAMALGVMAVFFLAIRLGASRARRRLAEKTLKRAKDAEEIDERVRRAGDADLDRLLDRSQR